MRDQKQPVVRRACTVSTTASFAANSAQMRASLEERPLGTLVASLNMLRRCRNRGELASAAVAQITRTHAGCEAVLGVAANWLLQLTHHQRRIINQS